MHVRKRILLTCLGTLGEVLPIRNLARELVRRGDEVHVCGPGHGRAFFGSDVASYTIMPCGIEDRAPTGAELSRIFARDVEYVFEDIDRHCEAAVDHLRRVILDSRIDEVKHSWITPAAALAAHACGVPHERVYLYPLALNQRADPPVIARWRRMTAASRDLATRQRLRDLARQRYERLVPRLRRLGNSIGLPPEAYDLRHDGASGPAGLALFDPRLLLVPEPGVTFLGLPPATDLPPHPPEVSDFLASHGAPVVVSLGSGSGAAKERATSRIVRAARALSVPVLLILGVPGPRQVIRRPNMLVLSEFPLAAAAPLARLVVHHAGIGSLQETLRAGRPALAMPLLYDQFDNARRLEALGLGAATTLARTSDGALAALLARTLGDARMGARCAAWKDGAPLPAQGRRPFPFAWTDPASRP